MSLNKFTDTKVKKWMRIGCSELRVKDLDIVGDAGNDNDVLKSDNLGFLTLQPLSPEPPPNVLTESYYMWGNDDGSLIDVFIPEFPVFGVNLAIATTFNSTPKPAYYTSNASLGTITFLESGFYIASFNIYFNAPAEVVYATFLINGNKPVQSAVAQERVGGNLPDYLHLVDAIEVNAGDTLQLGISLALPEVVPPYVGDIRFWKAQIFKIS